jgi:hypothetical protein
MHLATIALLFFALQIPKNDPTGTWEAETGTQYKLQLSGSDLKVLLVEGSNPVFLKYEVNLKNQEEINTYKGKGSFTAKLRSGKECTFDTEWEIVVVQTGRIIGSTTTVVPDPETCEVKEKSLTQINLVRKQ